MHTVPLSQQNLPPDYLLKVQTDIEAGKTISGNDLLLMMEQAIAQPLPEAVRDIVRRCLIPAVKERGRPSKFSARLDFALERVDRRYPALRRYEERKKKRLLESGKGTLKGDSPSRLAYERLLKHMKFEFGPITPEALGNMHSRWRHGAFHHPENDTDSLDHEALIERHFPVPPSS